MTKEASKAVEKASYECGVLDTETRLAEEVARVCRDYYIEVWTKALNQAGVPINSELRSARNIFFPKDIREFSIELPPPVALPLPPPEQSLTIQDSSLDVEVLVEAGKGMEVQPLVEVNQSKDILTIRDVVSKAKDAEGAKLKAANSKEGPHPTKE